MDYDPCWARRTWLRGALSAALLCCMAHISGAIASEAIAAAASPVQSTAEESKQRPLRVIKLHDYAASNGQRDVVLETKMLLDFAESSGFEIEWLNVFRAEEALQLLLDGDGDLSISAVPVDNVGDARLRASEPIAVQRFRIVAGNDETLDSPLDLAGMSLAVKLSSPLWPYLNRLRGVVDDLHLQVLPNEMSHEETLQMVNDGVYDAALVATEVGAEPIADFPRLKYLLDLTGAEPVSWFAQRDDAHLIEALNEYIKRFHTAYHKPNPSARTFADIKRRGVLRVITRLDGNNYFLKRGRPAGFELELARRFAKKHGLRLDVLVGRDDEEILRWLRDGAGDLVTARIDADYIHGEPAFSMSREYRHDASVLVTSWAEPIDAAEAVHGKTIAGYEGSAHLAALEDFVSGAGTAIGVEQSLPMSVLLERVEAGIVDAAVIDAHKLESVLATHADLVAGMSIPNPYRYRWTVRGEDGPLLAAVEEFIQTEYRDDLYNVLERRYARGGKTTPPTFGDLSPFDNLLQTYSDRYGFDWRLIAAQMYQESHFDPNAVSTAGAVGLMQLMPKTAQSLNVGDPGDPEAGIHAGIKYLDRLRNRFDSHIPMIDRTWLALAAYNIGYDRVRRARTLAHELGLNPDKWFGNVEVAMRQMTRSNFNSAARCRCGQAIVYVRAIRSLYYAYRNLALAVTTPGQVAPTQAALGLAPSASRSGTNRRIPVQNLRSSG